MPNLKLRLPHRQLQRLHRNHSHKRDCARSSRHLRTSMKTDSHLGCHDVTIDATFKSHAVLVPPLRPAFSSDDDRGIRAAGGPQGAMVHARGRMCPSKQAMVHDRGCRNKTIIYPKTRKMQVTQLAIPNKPVQHHKGMWYRMASGCSEASHTGSWTPAAEWTSCRFAK